MIPTELICYELKRLAEDYYKCENPVIKELIHADMKLLSEALFLMDMKE